MDHLRIGTTSEPPLQASKWLSCQALLDVEEMSHLLDSLGIFFLYICGHVFEKNKRPLSKEEFLKHYASYIDSLKQGVLPPPESYRMWFSPAMTVSPDALFSIPVGTEQQIIRVSKPVVQLQAHHLDFSPIDKKFRPMIFGIDSITWGIQFSYPQLYQDGQTKQVVQIKNDESFPNTALFHTLQRWMRQHTIPTPFCVEGIKYNVPMRLGKKSLGWINKHPQLILKGITVA